MVYGLKALVFALVLVALIVGQSKTTDLPCESSSRRGSTQPPII